MFEILEAQEKIEQLEVDIENPDMIDSTVGETFNSLKVDAEFSFKDK